MNDKLDVDEAPCKDIDPVDKAALFSAVVKLPVLTAVDNALVTELYAAEVDV